MPIHWGDFETKSGISITETSTERYLHDPQADILMLGYAADDDRAQIWVPGMDVPDALKYPDEFTHYYHNAMFDIRVLRILGPRYGLKAPSLDRVVDTEALARRYTFPGSLAKIGEILELPIQKDSAGKALIEKICLPPFKYTEEEWLAFKRYCVQDVEAMREIVKNLPASALSPREHRIWQVTADMNTRGVPVDIREVARIKQVTEVYKEEHSQRLPEITGGRVTKVTQNKRIVDFLASCGVETPNLQAPTVTKLLERDDLPEAVIDVLTLRQELGKSSTAKYDMLLKHEFEARVRDNTVYYGGHTGRWAGRNFQIQNLPKLSVDDPDQVISDFFSLEVLEPDYSPLVKGKPKRMNPVHLASALVRPMIKAPEGKLIGANDFTAVEVYLLMACAGQADAVEKLRRGMDLYVDMAAYLYALDEKDVSKEQRFYGKVIILGCGYGMGARQFVIVADSWGLKVTDEEAQRAVQAYRQKFSMVPKMWRICNACAMSAIQNPGKTYEYLKTRFRVVKDRNSRVWLQVTLPTGATLYYYRPRIVAGRFGPAWGYRGMDQVKKIWTVHEVSPGTLVENIIQALAREALADAKIALDDAGFEIIGSMHDEVVVLLDEETAEQDFKRGQELMIPTSDWLRDIPFASDGYISKRYKKG